MSEIGELLRQSMRHWPTGVTVVTSISGAKRHGMTVNSFASISLEPAVVTITLAHAARTYHMVTESGIAGITILSHDQVEISDRFAGRIPEDGDRFARSGNVHAGDGNLRLLLAAWPTWTAGSAPRIPWSFQPCSYWMFWSPYPKKLAVHWSISTGGIISCYERNSAFNRRGKTNFVKVGP